MFKKLICCLALLSLFAITHSVFAADPTITGSVLLLDGEKVGSVKVFMRNSMFKIMLATGDTVPSDGTANYAKGCLFVDNDAATGIASVYVNIGTTTSCKFRLQGSKVDTVNSPTAIATTGSTPIYTIVPMSSTLTEVSFAANSGIGSGTTNYITWQITNLGQDGTGANTLLHGSSTTKPPANGGMGTLGTNTTKALTLTGTTSSLALTKGDRLKLDVAVTGTLPNTLTYPSWQLVYGGSP